MKQWIQVGEKALVKFDTEEVKEVFYPGDHRIIIFYNNGTQNDLKFKDKKSAEAVFKDLISTLDVI